MSYFQDYLSYFDRQLFVILQFGILLIRYSYMLSTFNVEYVITCKILLKLQ